MATPPPDTQQALTLTTAAVAVNSAKRSDITARLTQQVRTLLGGFKGWYDDAAVAALARQVASLVRAAQQQAASAEDAYLTHVISSLAGQTVRPGGVIGPTILADLRHGVDQNAVYQRLGVTYRYEVSTGKSDEAAVKAVTDRAATMLDTDVANAVRVQDQKTLATVTHLVTGYRRVIHPELAKGGTCGMCIAASDRIYKTGELMPIHDRCNCTTAPIMRSGADPGSGLNNLDLATLYDQAGGTQADSLKRTRYQVDDHGELLSILTPKRRNRSQRRSQAA